MFTNLFAQRAALFHGSLLVGTEDVFAHLQQLCWEAIVQYSAKPVDTLSAEEIWSVVQQVRVDMKNPQWCETIARCVQLCGIRSGFFVDSPTLRCSVPNGHTNPLATKAYGIHRDTWYGYPAGMVNVWVPLLGHNEHNGMEVFANYFDKAVANNSWGVAPNAWAHNTVFPECLQAIDDTGVAVFHPDGRYYLFSGQHLHRGQPNTSGVTRWSVDFRLYFNDTGPELTDYHGPVVPHSMRPF